MTDTPDESVDGPAEEVPTEETPVVEEQSNVNGEVLDVATVNAHVVGVIISEGGGDPQTAPAETAEG